MVCLSLRKLLTYCIIHLGIPFLRRTSSSLKGTTISKAPEMSRESRDATYLPEFYIV